jgi:hypothetical protein
MRVTVNLRNKQSRTTDKAGTPARQLGGGQLCTLYNSLCYDML